MFTLELTENQFFMLIGSIAAVRHITDGKTELGIESHKTTRLLMDQNQKEYDTLLYKLTQILDSTQ